MLAKKSLLCQVAFPNNWMDDGEFLGDADGMVDDDGADPPEVGLAILN